MKNHRIERFFIVTNEYKDPNLKYTELIRSFFQRNGRKAVYIPESSRRDRLGEIMNSDTDCLLVLGGDGTVLRASRQVVDSGVPILGINLGTMGYLAEVDLTGWTEALGQLLSGDFSVEERMMLMGRVTERGNITVRDGQMSYALNDVVISRSGVLQVLNYNVYVDGQLLNSFSADGVILATPTGSTAYSMSAGGPIVEPTARLIVMTPICPHQLNTRSIILSAEDNITIEIMSSHRGGKAEAYASFDGDLKATLDVGDKIVIGRADKTTHLIKLSRRSFLETVHRKMSD